MASMHRLIIYICVLIGCTYAVDQINGVCPEKQPISNLTLSNFVGDWIELKRFDKSTPERDCVKATISDLANGKIMIKEQYKILSENSKEFKFQNDTLTYKDSRRGEFIVHGKHDRESQFLILDTDYKTFAVMWSCETVENTNKSIGKC